jgi:hypothetical protein
VIRLEGPAHDQDILDIPRGLQVGQRRLHPASHQPVIKWNLKNTLFTIWIEDLFIKKLKIFKALTLTAWKQRQRLNLCLWPKMLVTKMFLHLNLKSLKQFIFLI